MERVALALIAAFGCANDEVPLERGRVTVHVLRDELAVEGAAVVFHDATGKPMGTARTDQVGVATGEITTAGLVTVFDPDLAQRLTTIVRVELGSTLEIALTPVQATGARVRTLTIDAPSTPAPAGTVMFDIQTPCWREYVDALPATIALPASCALTAPVVIVARSEMQSLEDPGETLAYVATRIDQDGHARFGAWSTSCTQVAITTDVQMSLQLWPRFGNHAFRWLDLGFCGVVSSAQPTVDFGEGVVATGYAYVDGSPMRTTSTLRDFMTVPTTLKITTTSDLLTGSITGELDGDGAQWSTDPALADVDAIDAKLEWLVAPGDYLVWRFVLPPDAARTSLPQIPAELDTWGTLADADDVILELRYVDANWIENLAEVHRELPLILDGAESLRAIPRGSTLRDFVQRIYPRP